MPERPGQPLLPSRHLGLVLAVVSVVAGIGFMTGTAPGRYVAASPPPRAPRPSDANAQPARTHAELSRSPWRGGVRAEAGQAWDPRAALGAATLPTSSPAAVAAALEARAATRAYDGAPPTIPHPVRQGSAAECRACHEDGLQLGAGVARQIPHDDFASCSQCHVVEATTVPRLAANAAATAGTSFVGARSPSQGVRAYEGAPPTVPHTTWLRNHCNACHGPSGRAALQTPHPDRQSCLQCHAPSAQLDRRARG